MDSLLWSESQIQPEWAVLTAVPLPVLTAVPLPVLAVVPRLHKWTHLSGQVDLGDCTCHSWVRSLVPFLPQQPYTQSLLGLWKLPTREDSFSVSARFMCILHPGYLVSSAIDLIV